MHSRMIIWRIFDGRPGHDNQSLGLVNALDRLAPCIRHDIAAQNLRLGIVNFLVKKYPPGTSLPRPDLVIGAGHQTHLPVLCAQRASGGKSVILMRPTLPCHWFDYCLVPEHDLPSLKKNVIITRGVINTILPSDQHIQNCGLILIGGPSRHYDWDQDGLIDQIKTVIAMSGRITWQITDSPRTPSSTSQLLEAMKLPDVSFHSHKHTAREWLPGQLARAGCVWVSADSMSMIYESLTSGSPTGLLKVPEKKPGRITRGIDRMIQQKLITGYTDWLSGIPLSRPPESLNEAWRCALLILESLPHT